MPDARYYHCHHELMQAIRDLPEHLAAQLEETEAQQLVIEMQRALADAANRLKQAEAQLKITTSKDLERQRLLAQLQGAPLLSRSLLCSTLASVSVDEGSAVRPARLFGVRVLNAAASHPVALLSGHLSSHDMAR